MDIDQIRRVKEQNDAFTEWRKKVAVELPDLAARIFALRDKGYPGCGFHWGMEKELGYVICKVNDYDDGELYHGENAIAFQITLEVRYEALVKQLADAEKSVRKKNMTEEQWVLDWIKENVEASSVNQKFHDEFHAQFGGARKFYFWGAQPVRKAMRLLSKLHQEGKLDRRRISLGGNWQPGFPKHCLSYALPSTSSRVLTTVV